MGQVLPLVTTRITRPGGAVSKNSPCFSSSSYRNCAMPPFSSILSRFYCYLDSSLLVFSGHPLGPAPAASVVSSFCYRVSSARICVLPASSALLFMGMWWETDSWLRVQSALGALYSVADLATRYILLGLVFVIHTYSPPFLVMNIYMIFGNTSRTLLEHKRDGLLASTSNENLADEYNGSFRTCP